MNALLRLTAALLLVSSFEHARLTQAFKTILPLDVDCDAPAPAGDIRECCKPPVLSQPISDPVLDEKMSDDCKKELLNNNYPNSSFSDCLDICLKKKNNLLDENSALKKDPSIVYMKNLISATDAWYQPTIDSIEFCSNTTDGKFEEFKEIHRKAGTVDGCIPTMNFYTKCMMNYMIPKCPETAWVRGEQCDSLKKYHDACGYMVASGSTKKTCIVNFDLLIFYFVTLFVTKF